MPTFRLDIRFVYSMSRNAGASGPWTSILPSVEPSMKATFVRAALHSRATAACHVLARLRVVPRPFPLPDVLELGAVGARASRAHRWCAPGRTGRRAPGRPAWRTRSACTAAGRWWCRARPARRRARGATTAVVSSPDVLPWSWAVPAVVYRLTCSTEASPAPVARTTSATVTSRCTSTKWVVRCAGFDAVLGDQVQRDAGGRHLGEQILGRAAMHHRLAGQPGVAAHGRRRRATHLGGGPQTAGRPGHGDPLPGTGRHERADARSNASLPPACEYRCTAGFQPPETASRSAGTRRSRRPGRGPDTRTGRRPHPSACR